MLKTIAPPRAVTPGVYDAVVTAAEMRAMRWRQTAANPDGLAVKLGVSLEDAAGEATIFDAVDAHNIGRIETVFAAAGVPFSKTRWRDSLHLLVGRPVRVCPKNITPAAGPHRGITKAVVACWITDSPE